MSAPPLGGLPSSNTILSNPVWDGNFHVASVMIAICATLSLANALELLILVFTTFKRYSGMYFWSLLISTYGIIAYSTGSIFEYYRVWISVASRLIDTSGWVAMVTGQSLVLYSRLYLLFSDTKVLKRVKIMIIVDAVIYHITTTILQYMSLYGRGSNRSAAQRGYKYFEKIQMTGFCLQEAIISGLYIWKATQIIRLTSKPGARRILIQLLTINIVVVILDVALLTVAYLELQMVQLSMKSVVYSMKLKLEFSVLGKLVELVQSSHSTLSDALIRRETHSDGTMSSSSRPRRHRKYHQAQWLELNKPITETVKQLQNQSHVARQDSECEIEEHVSEVGKEMTSLDRPSLTSAKGLNMTNKNQKTDDEASLMYADTVRQMSRL